MDLRLALRSLQRNPAFSTLIIVTIAFGIGLNTLMFSVVRAVFLRPLDFPHQERLVTLWESDVEAGILKRPLTPANFVDLTAQSAIFEAVGVLPNWSGPAWSFNVAGPDRTEQVRGVYASSGFFDVLGVPALIGRTLGPESDRNRGEHKAVISFSLWRERFGSSPSVLGKRINIDSYGGGPFTIIGVMPDGFEFPRGAGLWLSLADWGGGPMPARDDANRCCAWYTTFARLKPGVSPAQATAQLADIARTISSRHPQGAKLTSIDVESVQETLVGSQRLLIWLLCSAVACLLLIGCANVANLLLSRNIGRRREISTRLALGAGRGRVARQFLVEALVFTGLGAAAGLLLATWTRDLLVGVLAGRIPLVERITIDLPVLSFLALLTITCAAFFGIAPLFGYRSLAWQQRAGSEPRVATRIRTGLVVFEIALAVMLVCGSGLLIRTVAKLQSVDLGFRMDRILAASVDLTTEPLRERGRGARYLEELLARVEALPGVRSAAAATAPPMEFRTPTQAITREGAPVRLASDSPRVLVTAVTPGYLSVMGIPLKQGRFCSDGDTAEGNLVAVLNETAARRYWPKEDPVGKRFALGSRERFGSFREVHSPDGVEWRTIVGIIGDVRSAGYNAPIEPEVYFCHKQSPLYTPTLLIHTAVPEATLATAVRQVIRNISSRAVVERVVPLPDIAAQTIAVPRARAGVVLAFSVAALLLGMLGIYGIMSDAVARRTSEIAIRMALGARTEHVTHMFWRESLHVTAIGVAIGLAGALVTGRFISSFLFEVTPEDPVTLLGTIVLFAATALLASHLPARRAAAVEPAVALHGE